MYRLTYYTFFNIKKLLSFNFLFNFWFQLTLFNFFLYIIIFKNYFNLVIWKKRKYLLFNVLKSSQRFKKFKYQLIIKKNFFFFNLLPKISNKLILMNQSYLKVFFFIMFYTFFKNNLFFKILKFSIFKKHYFNF